MISVENPELLETGPIVTIRVGVSEYAESALRRGNRAVPEAVPARALIDTGSGRSLLRERLAHALALTPVGRVEFDTPGSTDVPALEYYARFWVDRSTSFESKVLAAPLPSGNLEAVIGRDILALGVLRYDGPGRKFSFDFGPVAGRPHSEVR